LADGYASYAPEWVFPNAQRGPLMRALGSRGLPLERVVSPFTCLLVQTGRNVALVDTGAGCSSPTSGAILARLEMEGVRPRDVDTVVISHAHPDHIGGAVDAKGRPVFSNARHVISDSEIEFWTATRVDLRGLRAPADIRVEYETTARRSLAALRLHLEPISQETEVFPGLTAIPAPGHTPGHLAVMLESAGEKLLNVGDAAAHPLHLENPDWEGAFDLAAARAIATRRTLLQRASDDGMRVMAFHFPFPSVGRISPRDQGGWEWSPGR
jgi:glyoxylase-like metal-dependent hydrolase (beta-lactamase superfamily II)